MTNIYQLIDLLETHLSELHNYHREKAAKLAQEIKPELSLEDLLNPDDFPALINDPTFMHQDGIAAGVMSAKISVRALLCSKDL